MRRNHYTGFTLVELMIALSLSTSLVLAISLSYSSIKRVTQTTTELEMAQEVLRYGTQIFARSIKQTQQNPTLSADSLTINIQQSANNLSCVGTQPDADYTEVFTITNDRLTCDVGDGPQDILAGITSLTFAYDSTDRIFTLTITPEGLPLNYVGGVSINIAASTIWLNDYFGTL